MHICSRRSLSLMAVATQHLVRLAYLHSCLNGGRPCWATVHLRLDAVGPPDGNTTMGVQTGMKSSVRYKTHTHKTPRLLVKAYLLGICTLPRQMKQCVQNVQTAVPGRSMLGQRGCNRRPVNEARGFARQSDATHISSDTPHAGRPPTSHRRYRRSVWQTMGVHEQDSMVESFIFSKSLSSTVSTTLSASRPCNKNMMVACICLLNRTHACSHERPHAHMHKLPTHTNT